ncbi:inter-alpha-trypsin inhibitor heavy chain H4-like [Gracilinanus agilis]|uniref:inter-alpha-trypsin inhibitor heavy chain H4-like n=1 Tax=Gracilinanus agilis TaxID=191870 RepID=UPI001CFD856E|nr:inter-alpha-trypsin inhibitor heavy chain H4-like [Gracilinanus agilis]
MEAPTRILPLCLLIFLLASSGPVAAEKDGIDIYSLTLDSKVTSRFAHTTITSRVVNKAEEAREAVFQVELPKTALITNFSILMAVSTMQIENGYFVHHFAPAELPTLTKNVVFVIDKSGSMLGRKITQTREALVKILDDLNPEDQFNLVIFNGRVTQWKPSLLQASTEHVEEAKKFARSIQADGYTNINEAVLLAVKMLDESNRREQLPEESISLVILLTDGDPTKGEKDPKKIQENVKGAIGGSYYLYCLGFGFDVNYAFLEKLALENGGVARRIYEDSDADLQLQDFYQEVANPLLTKVEFQYPDNSVEQLTKDNFLVFFRGSELVVAGKLKPQVEDLLSAKVKGQSRTQNFTFQTEVNVEDKEKVFQSPKYIFHNFMERLWAYLTIQQLLEKAVSASADEKKSLEARALGLSLNFSFVTPLTSMVVTKPEGQDQAQVASKPVEADNNWLSSPSVLWTNARMSKARKQISKFSAVSHRSQGLQESVAFAADNTKATTIKIKSGTRSRSGLVRNNYKIEDVEISIPSSPAPVEREPHFILSLSKPSDKGSRWAVCMDVKESSQTPLRLISDPTHGIEVTGKYEERMDKFVWLQVSYKTPEVKVRVTQDNIVVTRGRGGKSSSYQWQQTLHLVMSGLKLTLENGVLLLSAPDKVTIGLVSLNNPTPRLQLSMQDPADFFIQASGILGQLYQDLLLNTVTVRRTEDTWEQNVGGKNYTVTRNFRRNFQRSRDTTQLPTFRCQIYAWSSP